MTPEEPDVEVFTALQVKKITFTCQTRPAVDGIVASMRAAAEWIDMELPNEGGELYQIVVDADSVDVFYTHP